MLLGAAGGSFTGASHFAVGNVPLSVAVGDFDGDGDPDLAVAKLPSDNVAVLLNRRPPSATGDAYTTDEDAPLEVTAPGVLGNDTDPDGDALTATLVSGPSHGSLKLDPDGSLTYTPAANFNGSDSFTYRASDGSQDSNAATVRIDVTAVDEPSPAAPAPTAPVGADPSPAPPATGPAIAGLRLAERCVRRSRAGRARVRMTLRLARPGPVWVRIDRARASKGRQRCPTTRGGRRRRSPTRYRHVATVRRVPTRAAAAAAIPRRLALDLRLTPGLYRLTVRARLGGNRLSRPARAHLRVV